MKQFTYSQKKWALTSCLMLALGFSLSVHQQRVGGGSVDMASNSVEAEFGTPNGKVKVLYVKAGDKTTAVVTEGKICMACEDQNFVMSTAYNADDIASMNAALLKYVYVDSVEKKPSIDADSNDAAETPEALSADEKADKAFDAIKEVCESKEGQEALACSADNFKALLKGKPSSALLKILKSDNITAKDLKKIDKSKAAAFYKSDIAPLIGDQVKEAKRISLVTLRAKAGNADAVEELEMMDNSDFKAMRQEALDSVKDLMADLPKDYKNVRQLLTSTEKAMVFTDATEFQTDFNKALTTQDPQEMARLRAENQTKRDSLLTLMASIKQVNSSGLSDAQRAKLIGGEDVQTYSDFFNSYAKLITDGISLNPTTFTIPTPDGSPQLLDLTKLGRIALTGGSAFVNDEALPLQTNAGVYFGDVKAVTAEDLAIINANRAQLGLPTR